MSKFALLSVPIAAGLAYFPHIAKVFIQGYHGVGRLTHPRENAPTKSLVVNELVDRLKNCHFNQLESLGAYSAGIAAATAMGISPDTTKHYATVYVIARAAYIVAYAAPQKYASFGRSATFAAAWYAIINLWTAAAGKAV